ncbi:hypothetical protein [Sphingomonas endophytica]|nr:hypothetical protein [Sphingomonas endophytica]
MSRFREIEKGSLKPAGYLNPFLPNQRKKDRYLSLDKEAFSNQSINLSKLIEKEIITFKIRRNRNKEVTKAASAIFAGLLCGYHVDPTLYSYLPMGKINFAPGAYVGYNAVRDTIKGLRQLDLIEFHKGYKSGSIENGEGEATTLKPTMKLLELALSYGITPATWHDHYRYIRAPATVAKPVLLRAKRKHGDKYKGKAMPLEPAGPKLDRIIERVQTLNTYLSKQNITGLRFNGLQRIYACGDDENFDWNMGARLYALGADNYQNAKKIYRANLMINGEKTKEIDLSGSHFTILHGLRGESFDPTTDPYDIPGYPREVIKCFINQSLGHCQFHRRWPEENVDKLAERGISLKDYPIDNVRAAVLNKHPILTTWKDSPFRWQHFHFVESEAIIDAMYELAFTYDVPALPLHDSLIVPESRIELADAVLKKWFKHHVGIVPGTKVKTEADLLR